MYLLSTALNQPLSYPPQFVNVPLSLDLAEALHVPVAATLTPPAVDGFRVPAVPPFGRQIPVVTPSTNAFSGFADPEALVALFRSGVASAANNAMPAAAMGYYPASTQTTSLPDLAQNMFPNVGSEDPAMDLRRALSGSTMPSITIAQQTGASGGYFNSHAQAAIMPGSSLHIPTNMVVTQLANRSPELPLLSFDNVKQRLAAPNSVAGSQSSATLTAVDPEDLNKLRSPLSVGTQEFQTGSSGDMRGGKGKPGRVEGMEDEMLDEENEDDLENEDSEEEDDEEEDDEEDEEFSLGRKRRGRGGSTPAGNSGKRRKPTPPKRATGSNDSDSSSRYVNKQAESKSTTRKRGSAKQQTQTAQPDISITGARAASDSTVVNNPAPTHSNSNSNPIPTTRRRKTTSRDPSELVSARTLSNTARAIFSMPADKLTPEQKQKCFDAIFAKRAKNTEAARRSREKRKEYVDELEMRVRELEEELRQSREEREELERVMMRQGVQVPMHGTR